MTFQERLPFLKKIEGQPKLYLHPIDADDKGIQNGERVRIWNQRGSCTFIACVAQDVLPYVVVSQGLWWQDEDGAYQSVNTLTSQRLSDMGRGATFFSTRVDIEKA